MRLVLVCAIAVALFSAPAWGQAGQPPTIRADVAEWSVVPSVGVVPAGRVQIQVRNVGQAAHQLTLVRTDSFDPILRLRGDRAVVRPLATSVVVQPGRTSSFVVSLRRGSYLLLDNRPWSYWKGTSVAFSVR
jgi:hypothetical protein